MELARRRCKYSDTRCEGRDYLEICRPCLLDRFETLACQHFHFGDIEALRAFKKREKLGLNKTV